MAKTKQASQKQSTTDDMPQPWSKPAKTKKAKAPLTIEQRMDRVEKDFRFLAAKLRTHGIHLETQTEPEPENVNASTQAQDEEE